MIQLVLSPRNGWEDIDKSNIPVSELLSQGLYPLMGVASLASFCSLIYKVDSTIVSCIQSAVITFISFFVTYFFANLMFTSFASNLLSNNTPDGQNVYELNSTKASIFIIYNLGVLAILAILSGLIPVQHSLLQFFPFLVALLMWKGADFMNVPADRVGHFTFLSVFSILVPIYLLRYFFDMLLS